MKSGVAMQMQAFVAAHESGSLATPVRLVILERRGERRRRRRGSSPKSIRAAFDGAKHALGEFGGATQWIAGKPFYPIQVAEKQMCWMRAHVRGTGGHGALGVKGGAMRKLGDLLRTLDRKQPPVHIIPLVREWFEAMAAELPSHARTCCGACSIRELPTSPRAPWDAGCQLSRVIRNTASPTIVHGGDKVNVIPSEIELQIDGRILPGQTPDDLIRELHDLVGNDVEFEVIRHDPGPPDPDLSFYGAARADRARPSSRQCAGAHAAGRRHGRAVPQPRGRPDLRLVCRSSCPKRFDPFPLVHNADERVPADALAFGVEAITQAIARYPA